ncbi:AVAST type 3 anti-phage protein Avs3b [Burkholderia gladioli]|uniref:AVAST type 3 anti-phage proein Avs3b n=1 Tax=Burkholderia gladioli TaxID=28095 RepID=UPI003F7916BA
MESLDRSKAVIDLGKRLVTELNLGDDLLAQWMAHVIAERMDAVERASSATRAPAQDACMQAIYSLWEHRHNLPLHMRPFRELDPLLRTLDSLDVDKGARFRYFPIHPSDEELAGAEVSGKNLLETAVSLDYTARALIQYLLSAATQGAIEKAIPWLDAAIDADVDTVLEMRVVEFVSSGELVPSAQELARKALLNKIDKLETFSRLATHVAAEFKRQLDPVTWEEDSHDT